MSKSKQEGGAPLYALLQDMPGLKAGAIFERRPYDRNYPDRGNQGNGALVLAWINGNCQQEWAGEAFILPGQLAADGDWFERVVYTYGLCEDHYHVNGSTFVPYKENP